MSSASYVEKVEKRGKYLKTMVDSGKDGSCYMLSRYCSAFKSAKLYMWWLCREKLKKIQSSSVSFGGGKKRLDAGAETGDGVPAEVEEEESSMDISSTEADKHFISNNVDSDVE